MKRVLLLAAVLAMISIESGLCFSWEDLGKKVGELQDKTGQVIEGSAQNAKQWWDEEGEKLTRTARRKARRTAEKTVEHTQEAAEGFAQGYREYWDHQARQPDRDNIYAELKDWLESVWGSIRHTTDKNPEEIMGDFQRWWEQEGRRKYKDIKTAFFEYIMSIREQSQG